MRKHLTAGRVIRYLLYLCIVSTLVFGVTYARYIREIYGQGTVSTAVAEMDVTDGGSGKLELTQKLQGLQPDEKREIDFQITNQKNGVVSEVAQEYSITIDTTGNLPLTYTLTPKNNSDSSVGTYAAETSSDSGSLVWTGGRLPYSAAGVSHSYTLTVEWPGDRADETLADEIDRVILTVDAKQALPAPDQT